MVVTDWKTINASVQDWFKEVRCQLLAGCEEELQVAQKSGRTDLVTNIDKQVEKYLVTQIKQTFPDRKSVV